MPQEMSLRRFRIATSVLSRLVIPAIAITFIAAGLGEEFERHEDETTDLVCGLVPAAAAIWLTVWIVPRYQTLGRRFFVGAGIATLLLVYPLSFGPACRLTQDGYVVDSVVDTSYRPMWWLAYHGPRPVRRTIRRWVDYCLTTPADWIGPMQPAEP